MIHVGIDCRFASTKSGLGCYTRELVHALLQRHDPVTYTLFTRFDDEDWLHSLQPHSYNLQPTPYPYYSLSEQLLLPGAIRDAKVDLYFAPHFNVPLLCPVPFIVTIHDLILHRFPNHASLFRQCAYRMVMNHAVKRAKHIITVSQTVADDLMKIYNLTKDAVSIIHEAVNPLFYPQSLEIQKSVREKYFLNKPFFLYVGNTKQHKNIPLLIEAFTKNDCMDTELVLVIGDGVLPKEVAGVRVLRSIPTDDLPALYSAAHAFITATSYEGFCLPVAEALACGCPVIATRTGAIMEMIGNRGMFIEPTVHSLISALNNPPLHSHERWKRGWEDVAEQTAEIFYQTLPSR